MVTPRMLHYQSLGLKFDATQDEIKSAYRRLAGVHHPDRGGSAEVFHRIQAAYEVLGEAKNRREYDASWSKKPVTSVRETAGELVADYFAGC
jgi:curved DNA-binding protein CbpA